jgi:hypothetical protein
MKLRPHCLAFLLLIALASPSWGSPPAKAAHVDPKAPCYRWPAVDMDGDGVFDRVDHCPNTPMGCMVDQYGCTIDSDGDGVCDGLDRCPNTPAGMKVDVHGCSAGQEELKGAKQTQATPAPAKENERAA